MKKIKNLMNLFLSNLILLPMAPYFFYSSNFIINILSICCVYSKFEFYKAYLMLLYDVIQRIR